VRMPTASSRLELRSVAVAILCSMVNIVVLQYVS
jgi:hypothetical protein